MPSSPQHKTQASFTRQPSAGLPDPLVAVRRDMAIWADPVIADCIFDGYRDRDMRGPLVTLVSTHHRRLWRAMILENRPLMNQIRIELQDDLERGGVEAEIVDEIDQSVMEELMDIVFKRFRASREMAKSFSLVLMSAASHLGESRALAS